MANQNASLLTRTTELGVKCLAFHITVVLARTRNALGYIMNASLVIEGTTWALELIGILGSHWTVMTLRANCIVVGDQWGDRCVAEISSWAGLEGKICALLH